MAVKVRHWAGVRSRGGLAGYLLSRMATRPGRLVATSTQLPPSAAGVVRLAPVGAGEIDFHGQTSFAQSAIISRDASGGSATARSTSYKRP